MQLPRRREPFYPTQAHTGAKGGCSQLIDLAAQEGWWGMFKAEGHATAIYCDSGPHYSFAGAPWLYHRRRQENKKLILLLNIVLMVRGTSSALVPARRTQQTVQCDVCRVAPLRVS